MKEEKALSELESVILSEAHKRYRDFGVPSANAFVVLSREFYSNGRRVKLDHMGRVDIEDGTISIAQVQIGHSDLLVYAAMQVAEGKCKLIEVFVVGDQKWEGDEERPFTLFSS